MFTQNNTSRLTALFTPCCCVLYIVLLALSQILFVCGCSAISKRPFQIPASAPGDEKLMSRPVIAGRYTDKGEAFTVNEQSVGQVSISQLLFGDAAADTVTVLEPELDMIKI